MWRFAIAAVIVLGIGIGLVEYLYHQNSTTVRQNPFAGLILKLGHSTVPVPVSHAYGIAAGGSLTDLNDQQLNQRLDGIAALGVKWVRFDFNWSLIQPNNSQDFQWQTYDKLVTASRQRNLNVLGIITYTPGWARDPACADSDKCRPKNPKQFADFAVALSARYKNDGLHYWEIWNEPNNPDFWKPRADPTGYVQLLQQTAPALYKEDHQAFVITGGLSPQANSDTSMTPVDFLNGVYRAGGRSYFDAVGDHPYTFPLSPVSSPDHAWNQMAAQNNSLRHIMLTNGDGGKKIWITEFGAPTGGPGPISTISNPNLDQHPYVVDEALQNKIMTDALALYKSYDWAGPFFWYSYQDAGTTPDTNENFFGLVRYNGSQKPAYVTYQDAQKQ